MREFIDRLNRCIGMIHANQNEEIQLEESLWEALDLCETRRMPDAFENLETELDSLDSICDTMIGNLEDIKKNIKSIQEWE